MLTWVAIAVVCNGPVVADCTVYAYRETFFEANECNVNLQSFLFTRQNEGKFAFGACKAIEVAGEQI
ncbi:hypothetical protein CRP738_gp49 [Roseobacter phage CRP-738]|nr:hypothetical protein CRP738_gp49 [Roseobacter phage CRP-738]